MTKSSTEDAIGLTRVHRWAPIPVQTERLEAAGVRVIVSLDKLNRDQLKRMVRERTVFKVLHASFLIEPWKRGAVRRLQDYQKFTEELANLKRGCSASILDVDTGFHAETAAQRRVMLALVREQIAKDLRGKASASNGRRGAQSKVFTTEQHEIAKLIWENVRRYPSWEDCKAAFKERVDGFTVYRAHRLWGPRHGETPPEEDRITDEFVKQFKADYRRLAARKGK